MERTESLYDTVGRLLSDIVPGARPVDRDLEIGGAKLADLAAIDGTGRLVLALFVEGRGDGPWIAAADALANARRNRAAIEQHLGDPGLRPQLDPIAVLIAEAFEPELLERLAALEPAHVRCAELRRVSSRSGGNRAFLTHVVPSASMRASAPRGGAGSFVEELAPELRSLGELVLRRVSRLDARLVDSASAGAVRWRLNDAPFCSAEAIGGELRVEAAGLERPRTLATAADLERFLDAVIGAQLGPAAAAEEPPLVGAAAGGLTPAEIAAFREPR